jgi:hypothetical protein
MVHVDPSSCCEIDSLASACGSRGYSCNDDGEEWQLVPAGTRCTTDRDGPSSSDAIPISKILSIARIMRLRPIPSPAVFFKPLHTEVLNQITLDRNRTDSFPRYFEKPLLASPPPRPWFSGEMPVDEGTAAPRVRPVTFVDFAALDPSYDRAVLNTRIP